MHFALAGHWLKTEIALAARTEKRFYSLSPLTNCPPYCIVRLHLACSLGPMNLTALAADLFYIRQVWLKSGNNPGLPNPDH